MSLAERMHSGFSSTLDNCSYVIISGGVIYCEPSDAVSQIMLRDVVVSSRGGNYSAILCSTTKARARVEGNHHINATY